MESHTRAAGDMIHYLSELLLRPSIVCLALLFLCTLGIFACTSGSLYYLLVGKEAIVAEESIVVVTGCDSGFGLKMALGEIYFGR